MDETRLPKSLLGLFGTAGSLYIRRVPLYLSLAAIAVVVQYLVGVVGPHTPGLITGLGIVVDAFIYAAVSIGIAFDLAEKPADWSTVLLAASERWGVVSVASCLYFLVFWALAPNVFGQPEDTGYGLLVLPIVIFWGALSLAQVVAAIEPVKTQLTLPFLALGKALAVSFRWPNISRLTLLSFVVIVPTVADAALTTVLAAHHIVQAEFWGNVPLDALTVGPVQALSTIFYIDFLRRARS
jgi:hypothetical protein